jgi:hypothetical protein
MRRVCFYHAGCPDGFGAAWATWRAWGDSALYVPRGHDDPLAAAQWRGDHVVFVDIAPPNAALAALGEQAARVVVLDHHVSSRDRYVADPGLGESLVQRGHEVRFDLGHSGAVLAWQHFHPGADLPELLAYVQDQDLWTWKLPRSREVNAAIASRPLEFAAWDELAATPVERLAAEGTPVVRVQQLDVKRALDNAHPVWVAGHRVEAVNALFHRALIGHELSARARFGVPCGAVYRVTGRKVDVSLYSIGDFDVAALASARGGGGHRNAAGFSVGLAEWLERFLG